MRDIKVIKAEFVATMTNTEGCMTYDETLLPDILRDLLEEVQSTYNIYCLAVWETERLLEELAEGVKVEDIHSV